MLWWLSHMTRIVMKLVTKAKKDCHSLIRPWDKETPDVDGSRRFRTSKVIAKAKTPSLKASVLAVSCASRLPTVSMAERACTRRVDLNLLTRLRERQQIQIDPTRAGPFGHGNRR